MFNKTQSAAQFRIPLGTVTSISPFTTKRLSPKVSTQTFRQTHRKIIRTIEVIENIESISSKNYKKQEIFTQLQNIWKENNIPEIHQKYFYFILTTNIASQEYLMQQELDSFKMKDSVVRTLTQLTICREICLKEALEIKQSQNIIEFVSTISNYLYDLRKLTINLIEYYRKWINKLYIQYAYNYQWYYQGENYIQKIKNDHKLLFINNPLLKKFFHIPETLDDIFYLSIINQAYERDLEYFDYLSKHKLSINYVKRIKDLQTFMAIQFSFKINENNQIFQQSHNLLGSKSKLLSQKNLRSGQETSRKNSFKLSLDIPPLPEYVSQIVYKHEDIEFISKQWPIKEIPQILSYWLSTNIDEFHKSFLQPSSYIAESLSYEQEAVMLQISQLGLILACIETDSVIRKWVIQLIICKEQIFDKIIQHFIKMMKQKGDSFQQLAINFKVVDYFQSNLKQFNFQFSKMIALENQKVNYMQYVIDIQRTEAENELQEKINKPLCFIYSRVLSRIKKLVITSDEETMEAQFCANLGSTKLINFSEEILQISKNLLKQKIIGQSFTHFKNYNDAIHACSMLKSPERSSVYLQRFTLHLQFDVFSSEIHKYKQEPYLRFKTRTNVSLDDDSLIQLNSSNVKNHRKVYLISTIDPSIKFFVYELKYEEVTLDIPQLITSVFEQYDKKQKALFNIWLPFFSALGNRQNLTKCQLNSYFTSETKFEINFPRIGMTSINNSFEGEKIINFPFVIGLIQNDLEGINKPIFSMLVQEDQIIKQCEPITVANIIDNEAQVLIMQINPKDIELRIKEFIRFSCEMTLQSFERDENTLIEILKFNQEACVIQLFVQSIIQGYCVLYIDKEKIEDRIWKIEMISCKNIEFFDSFLGYVVSLIFNTDSSASEILISQYHFLKDDGQIIVHKQISDAIKKVGFRWRLVDNDFKKKQRKTIYQIKRTQQFSQKTKPNVAIKFDSYYSLQESDRRNEETNTLQFLKQKQIFQFAEECFHYQLHKPYIQDAFMLEKIKNNVGLLPMTEFKQLTSQSQLQNEFNSQPYIPQINPKHTQILTQKTNLQLEWLRARPIIVEDIKYIEIPNEKNFIYISTFPKLNRRIYFIRLNNPQYFYFAMEISYNQIEAIKNEYPKFAEKIIQEFNKKQPQTSSDILIPQFEINQILSEQSPNWCYFNFSIKFHQTVNSTIIRELGSRTAKLQMPILTGLISEDIVLRYERPIVMYAAQDYSD